MPVTEGVIKQVEEMAVKDGAVKGINFKDRKGVEYKFDNDQEYKMLVEPNEPAPFPDIPAEVPGMLTELEEEYGVNEVVQDEPEESDEQQAMMAAENSGLDFLSIPPKASWRRGDRDTQQQGRGCNEQVQTRGSTPKDQAGPDGRKASCCCRGK
jgi:hypothetical protein